MAVVPANSHRGSSRRSEAFAFTKWYLDCVASDGRTAIGYWASLSWHGVSLVWQGFTVHEIGRPSSQRSTLAHSNAPKVENDRIWWRVPAFDCVFSAVARQPRFATRLFESEVGFVDWHCEAPAALVDVELAGHAPIRGGGYVEHITLTVPPWQLPVNELRWGRWMDDAAAQSLVWIDWRGPEPSRWVFADGVQAPTAVVTEHRVTAGRKQLTLVSPWTVSSRALENVIGNIPALRGVVPSSVLAWRETKCSSHGLLRRDDGTSVAGRAIHELVVFR